ncbi:MAG: hypothetical protein LBE21_01110 [Pseudomonadales bacterium]|nr:hypothetical protein [Pseudomonadales bacterium]
MILRLLALLLICLSTAACAASDQEIQDTIFGRWYEVGAYPGEAPIILDISETEIAFDTQVVYRTEIMGETARNGYDWNGLKFKVIGMDQDVDPYGCGPDDKVAYIRVMPLDNSDQITFSIYGERMRIGLYYYDSLVSSCGELPFKRKQSQSTQ